MNFCKHLGDSGGPLAAYDKLDEEPRLVGVVRYVLDRFEDTKYYPLSLWSILLSILQQNMKNKRFVGFRLKSSI